VNPASLYASPNALADHYRRFGVAERLLLTGHSHQAWPDRGFEAQAQAWLDAARFVDDKWEHAFARAERVRLGFRRLLDDRDGYIALAPNTHELVVRFLSALPLRERPRLVTTDGEFHTIRRQLDRLAEEGIELVRVPEAPLEGLVERLGRAVNDRTAALLVSAVFFDSGRIAPSLADVAEQCRRHGASLLVDVYHALNVVPFSLLKEGLLDAFVVGGGYKYCQLGEGNCFLRFPAATTLRPVITGWFSEFSALTEKQRAGQVPYGEGGDRFAGATYDPASHHYQDVAAYERSMKDANRWKRLLRGEVDLRRVARIAATHAARKAKALAASLHERVSDNGGTRLSRDLRTLLATGRRITMFEAEGEPAGAALQTEAKRALRKAMRSGGR